MTSALSFIILVASLLISNIHQTIFDTPSLISKYLSIIIHVIFLQFPAYAKLFKVSSSISISNTLQTLFLNHSNNHS
jgi:hypothetical protein